MQALTGGDLNFVVRRLPKDICDLLREYPLFVGGGFIRETIAGNEVKDIDVFGPNKDLLDMAAKLLCSTRHNRQATSFHTENAITVLCPPRLPVQFITRWCFDNAEPLVKSFDFTVCQAAIWYDKPTSTFRSMAAEGFYPDLAARRLVYTFPEREEEAGGSMLRARKFLQRGYSIQADSLAGVITRIARKVHWDRCNDEQEAARVITGLLHEVDPISVVDGLEPINEHQVIQP